MAPFCSMDRVNYTRWIPEYLSDMNNLETSHSQVYEKFLEGHHDVVCRTTQPFAQVWKDMVFEQTVRIVTVKESLAFLKTFGLSQNAEARERWFLSAHGRGAITMEALKEMFGTFGSELIGTHKSKDCLRPQDISERLVNAQHLGSVRMQAIVSSRI